VGGGVAGLETLLALRALAGARVELTLVAPDDEFVCRPLRTEELFEIHRRRRVSLGEAARGAGATFVAGTVDAVYPRAKAVVTCVGERFPYDALVLAVGAEPSPIIDNAITWDDRSGPELVGGLVREFEEGYGRSMAVVIPCGPGWPLRGYELALYIAFRASGMGMDAATTVVVQEPSPLWVLGSQTVEVISTELARAGVTVVSARRVELEPGRPITVVADPSGCRVEVDRVLALPTLHGRRIAGIPTDVDGFIAVDQHCRVRGLNDVWAAGDGTAFPVKSGGFAVEQAGVVGEDIAAAAGAHIEPRPFDPILHLPSGRLPMLTYLT
jgi:sulfide:quinone oxidoreductase